MMGLIDHSLTPLIVAWALAAVKRAAYDTGENSRAEVVARDALNAALEKLK